MDQNGKQLVDLKAEIEKINFWSRFWVVLSYCWVLAFIPYFFKARNEFVFFHARQGVILFITEIILIFLSLIPLVGQLISLIGSVFCFYFFLRALINGLAGRKWVLPMIGRYAQRLK